MYTRFYPVLSKPDDDSRRSSAAFALLLILLAAAPATCLRAQTANLSTLAPFFFTSGGLVPIRPLVQANNGYFYGTAFRGGSSNAGLIFLVDSSGDEGTLYDFANSPDGAVAPLAGLLHGSDDNLYGVTAGGGANGAGTLFQIAPVSHATPTTLYSFDPATGTAAQAAPTEGADHNLYGTCYAGGASNAGAIFKYATPGGFTILHTFNGADGKNPIAKLTLASDGKFYGTTFDGGAYNFGTVFSVTTDGTFTLLHSFDSTDDGNNLDGPVVQASDGMFYGTTDYGGTNGAGTVFRMDAAGNVAVLYAFAGAADGGNPFGGLLLASDGNLYGLTRTGGANGDGTVFQISTAGGSPHVLYSFTAPASQQTSDGVASTATLIQGADGNLYGVTQLGGDDNQGSVFSITTTGTYATVFSFTTDGSAHCFGRLTPDGQGNFYGLTRDGGSSENGSVFEYVPGINLFTVHNFSGTDGTYAFGSLLLARDGNFYGTTYLGGAHGEGTVFQLKNGSVLTTLYSFSAVDANGDNPDGARPDCGLVQAADGSLYGVTAGGGANNAGAFFKITTDGVFTSLHSFTAATEGKNPQEALLLSANGNFYGTCAYGGANGSGTVFSLTPAGSLTVLHSFGATDANGANTDGADPSASLAQAANGTFYGDTAHGGANATGTVFSLTPAGVYTVLHTFGVADANGFNADGAYPTATLAAGSDGNFYGATGGGGTSGSGTLFVITPGGTLTTLYDFAATDANGDNTTGAFPYADLLEITPGTFYGTAPDGGRFGVGTIFALTVSPAVISSTTASATVGQPFAYEIAGTNSPDVYTASPLPPGLTESTYNPGATGDRIAGTPTTAGTYAITLGAANAGGTGTATLNLTVNPVATPTPTPTPTPTATPTPTPTPVPGAQPTVVITSPPDGITVTVGEDLPLSAAITDPAGLTSQVRFSVGGTLVDTASAAPYVFDTVAPTTPGQYAIQVTVVDTLGRASTASVGLNVIATTDTALPVSGLLTPIDGRDLAAGSSLTISFTAAAAATTTLDHASLYADGALVATFDASGNLVSAAPAPGARPTRQDAAPLANLFQTGYTLPGTDKLVNLVAVAVDKLGQSTVSKVATVHAKVTADKAPIVAFGNATEPVKLRVGTVTTFNVGARDPDAPSTNAAPVAGLVHRADAASDATLALLEYYLNGTKIGEATQPPFSFTFTPPAVGKYILHAVATDGSGLATVSEPAVVEADPPPTVSLAVGGTGAAVEGGANGIILVTRTGDTSLPLTINYKAKGSAHAGVDYKTLPGTVTIPAGAVKAKIKIKPIDGSPNAGMLKVKIQPLVPTDGSYVIGTSLIKIKLIED